MAMLETDLKSVDRGRSYRSDRYGRNLNRIAREHERFSRMAGALWVEHGRRADRAEALLKDMTERLRRAVGAKSALLPGPPTEHCRPGAPRHPMTAPFPPRDDRLLGPTFLHADLATATIEVIRERLHHLVTEIEYRPEDYRTMLRWLDVRDGYDRLPEVTMVVSGSAIDRIGFTESDVEHLARDIARRMVAHREQERMKRAA